MKVSIEGNGFLRIMLWDLLAALGLSEDDIEMSIVHECNNDVRQLMHHDSIVIRPRVVGQRVEVKLSDP